MRTVNLYSLEGTATTCLFMANDSPLLILLYVLLKFSWVFHLFICSSSSFYLLRCCCCFFFLGHYSFGMVEWFSADERFLYIFVFVFTSIHNIVDHYPKMLFNAFMQWSFNNYYAHWIDELHEIGMEERVKREMNIILLGVCWTIKQTFSKIENTANGNTYVCMPYDEL